MMRFTLGLLLALAASGTAAGTGAPVAHVTPPADTGDTKRPDPPRQKPEPKAGKAPDAPEKPKPQRSGEPRLERRKPAKIGRPKAPDARRAADRTTTRKPKTPPPAAR